MVCRTLDRESNDLNNRFESLKKFLLARLSTKGPSGLYLTIGLLALMLASLIFGAIAEDIRTGEPLTIVDAQVNAWLFTHRTRTLTTLMLIITNLHSAPGLSLMTLAVCVYFWVRKLRHWVLTLLLALYGGKLLNFVLKHLFVRPRPSFNPIIAVTAYSFPSGHTMNTTVFYGTLCAFIVSRAGGWHWRALAVAAASLMISLVGFSRLYLGVHYLSDVLAAIAEGLAWLTFSLTLVSALHRRKERKRKIQIKSGASAKD